MKGGPIVLIGSAIIGIVILNSASETNRPPEDDPPPQQFKHIPAGAPGDPSYTGSNTNPMAPAPSPPPPGTIPAGSDGVSTQQAAVCFDGSGSHPPGDTYNPGTAYSPGGQPLNGDVTPYVVVNAQDRALYPLGSYVYVYNSANQQGTWAVVGDVGPTQNVNEVSVATAKNLGLTVAGNSVGGSKGQNVNISIYRYPPK